MSCPTLQGYIAFLTNVVKVNMANLPAFAGLGTLEEGSLTLAITAVTTGMLVDKAIVTDAQASIPTSPATTIASALSPDPLVGIGTYLMSAPAGTTQSTPEQVNATNEWIVTTFCVALETVNEILAIEPSQYRFAVYNLATDRLVNWAPDISGQTYFADLRRDMKIDRPALGVASSGSDQGTSGAVLNPAFMRNLTAADLQTLRTPWGRTYIGIAQDFGSTLFGVT